MFPPRQCSADTDASAGQQRAPANEQSRIDPSGVLSRDPRINALVAFSTFASPGGPPHASAKNERQTPTAVSVYDVVFEQRTFAELIVMMATTRCKSETALA